MRSVVMLLLAGTLMASGLEAPSFAETDWIKSLEKDCKAGDGFACRQWGGQIELGVFTPAEPVKARAAYERGCTLKDDQSCIGLFKMLSLGLGGPKDLARARELEPAACGTPIMVLKVDLETAGLCKQK